jgi:hypothetical protein
VKVLAQTEDCVVADGPAGDVDLAPVAAALSLDPAALHPVDELDPEVGGVRLLARSVAARERTASALMSGAASLEFRAITPTPLWRSSRAGPRKPASRWSRRGER